MEIAFSVLESKLQDNYPKEIMSKSITDLLYGGILMMMKSNKGEEMVDNYIENYEAKYPNWDKCEIINNLGVFKKLYLKAIFKRNYKLLKVLTLVHTSLVGK